MRRSEAGHTLIELCVTLTIISVLLRIGLPVYAEMTRAARAARAVSIHHALEDADFAFYAANARFANDTGAGFKASTPAGTELAEYLPRKFPLKDSRLSVRKWTTVVAPGGGWRDSMMQSGAMFTSPDTALVNRIYRLTRRTGWNTYLTKSGNSLVCVTTFGMMPYHR